MRVLLIALLAAISYAQTATTCSVSAQDCEDGKFCNHDQDGVGHCQSCLGIICNENTPSDRSPCCKTCSASAQDCGDRKFCNHDQDDVGHCQSCVGILCNGDTPEDRSPCCTCSASAQDCEAGNFCNQYQDDVGNCQSCEGITCDENTPEDRGPCCNSSNQSGCPESCATAIASMGCSDWTWPSECGTMQELMANTFACASERISKTMDCTAATAPQCYDKGLQPSLDDANCAESWGNSPGAQVYAYTYTKNGRSDWRTCCKATALTTCSVENVVDSAACVRCVDSCAAIENNENNDSGSVMLAAMFSTSIVFLLIL